MSGPVPINYSDIEAYCRLKGIYGLHEREKLLRLLDVLDRQYMADAYEKIERESKKNSPKPTAPGTDRIPRRPPRRAVG